MRKALLITALAILPTRLVAAEPNPHPSPLAGPVSYEVRSWGRLILRWQVNPDGSGEIWKLAEQKDKGTIRKFRLHLDGEGLKAFVADVEDVRTATRGGIKCTKEIFDLPYGTMTWDYPGAQQEYAFDAGCRSEKGDEAVEIIGAASTVVETLAKIDADPYAVEPAQ